MKKLKESRQLNNKGFSLVEVLVTLLIIGIISVPLITTFVNAAKVNHKSRRIQDATDTAQNLMEMFSTLSIEELTETYCEDTEEGRTLKETLLPVSCFTDLDSADSNSGSSVAGGRKTISAYQYAFSNISLQGAEGEDFKVDVTLSPSSYYTLPRLHNFFGDSEIVCVREAGRYDDYAITFLAVDRNGDGEISSDEAAVSRSAITKTVTIEVTTSVTGYYEYSLVISYSTTATNTYSGKSTYSLEQPITVGKGTIKDESNGTILDAFPTLYIVYDPFTTDGVKCYDHININYHNDGNATVKPVSVYFLPQNETDESGLTTTINNYLYINMTYDSDTIKAYDKDNANNKLKYYFYDTDSNKEMLVEGNEVVVSYDISIAVRYDGSTLTSITGNRELQQSEVTAD